MKTLRISIFSLLAMTAIICRAQITGPGWFSVQSFTRPAPTVITSSNLESQKQANLQFSPLAQPAQPSAPLPR